MVGSVSWTKNMRVAALVVVLVLLGASPARAGLSESIEAARKGNFIDAAKEIFNPARKAIEDGICDVVVATMPSLERSLGSVEALMADVYYFGHFVPIDYDAAVKWYLRAGDKGNALAQSALGDIYYYGRGVPQDFETAAAWWERAAGQGIGGAQLNLSVLYANGEGVEQNLVKSHMYANLAAAQLPLGKDYEIAVQNREYIAEQMTPSQILEAQQRAKEWQPASEQHKQASAAEEGLTDDAKQDAGPRRCRW